MSCSCSFIDFIVLFFCLLSLLILHGSQCLLRRPANSPTGKIQLKYYIFLYYKLTHLEAIMEDEGIITRYQVFPCRDLQNVSLLQCNRSLDY
jgi:hypothetical protein